MCISLGKQWIMCCNLFILLMLTGLYLQAQHPYAWNLTVEDGLPSLEVYDLYQDSKGYMWMGTDKGLCKYNGRKFFYYHNEKELGEAVSALQEDNEGRIWLRNFKNQIFYVEEDSMHYFEPMEASGITRVEHLVVSNTTLYVAGNSKKGSGIFKYDLKNQIWDTYFVPFSSEEGEYLKKQIYDMGLFKEEGLVVSATSGIFALKEDSLHLLPCDNLEKNLLVSIQQTRYRASLVLTMLLEYEGALCLSQYPPFLYNRRGYSFFRYNKNEESPFFERLIKVEKIARQEFIYCRELADGSLWQLTSNHGAFKIIDSASIGEIEGSMRLFPNEGVSDFLVDHEGNYWVSSLSNGVYILPQWLLNVYPIEALKETEITYLEKGPQDNLLVGTSNGVFWIYNSPSNQWTSYLGDSLGETIKCVKYFENKLLIVSSLRVLEVDLETKAINVIQNVGCSTWQNVNFYKDSTFVYSGGKEGVSMVNFRDRCRAVIGKHFPAMREIEWLHQGKRRHSRRIARKRSNWILVDEEQDRFLAAWVDTLMCYPEQGGGFPILSNDKQAIQATYLSRSKEGVIWGCTINKGVYGLDKDLKVIHHFTTKDGLISNKVKRAKAAGDILWLLTASGLQSFNIKTKENHIYTLEDGLPTLEIKDLEIVNDKVWLNTSKGLVSLDTQLPSENTTPPLVYIKRIAIHEVDTTLHPSYELDYTQNNLVIYVEGVAYRSRGKFKYQYRMLGVDSSWITQSSAVDLMRFPQLEPKNYTFEVKVLNEDGVVSKEVARVEFVIAPPYWQTWWFQGALYLLGTLMIVGVVLFRVRQKQKEERQQNLVNVLKMEALQSQMNPHFIFNVLTAVQNLWLQKKNELAMELQSNFAKLLRKIFQYSSKKAIPIEQVEEFLNNYLSLEQIRFENQIDISFEVEEELLDGDYAIPPLLIQPIIENSFKHGLFHKTTNRQLSIVLKEEGRYLYVSVEDNGVGRQAKKKQEPARSSGLTTTQERLKILQESIMNQSHPHNNIKITDLKDKAGKALGTKVELWIPFVDL
ncbi:sensor histidine kinase [Aureispira anguillae]|uniref:Histidine kinase n=1 Tax=Aureispira anguillae TaxID=2864201 RepID=A0A915YIX8_9BACT|nr:sensor histidine kinase [Aureispira anguillae]BDS14060.1 histidine kinase [Aureispira anguillae]